MAVYIQNIETSIPDHSNDQQQLREFVKEHIGTDRKTRAIIHRIYTQSGIETRNFVIDDFTPDKKGQLFFTSGDSPGASTAARNEVYIEESKKLFVELSDKLIRASGLPKDDITHIITVSCTGFFAPGPDYEIVKQLDLSYDTERFHIGFMGCYAAFPALKLARSICNADPDANVLIVSVELCSLHLQFNSEVDNLLSGSVFSDGASGVIVSSRKPDHPYFSIDKLSSALAPKGEKDMAWTIGDTGFNMVLSTYVPDIIEENIEDVVQPIFREYKLSLEDIDYWALHPGGRAIVDKVEQSLELEPHQVAASRSVLAKYGNMSSATVLFVIKELLDSGLKDGQRLLPLTFGPGLTIESGLLTYHDG